MSELSRVEDLLKTGVEEPVIPMSRLERILRGEKITPMSRVEELLLQYSPGGESILIEKRISENGTYYATTDNADGYFKVIVDTPTVPAVVLDHLVETITENGTYEYSSEHDGFEDASITVNVESEEPEFKGYVWIDNDDKTITVRVAPNGDVRIYFHGFEITNIWDTSIYDQPLRVARYLHTQDNYVVMSKSYAESDKTTQTGWVGMYGNTLRFWTIDTGYLQTGKVYGVLDYNEYGNIQQSNPYEEPDYAGVETGGYSTDFVDVSLELPQSSDFSMEGEIENE